MENDDYEHAAGREGSTWSPWRGVSLLALTTGRRHGATIAASMVVHAVLALGGSWVAFRQLAADAAEHSRPEVAAAPEAPRGDIEVELPVVGEGSIVLPHPANTQGDPPEDRAGNSVTHPDTGSKGHGGDRTDRSPALNLAEQDEHIRLSPDPLSHLDRDQLQRLRVARRRASWEDRRTTTHPAELTLVSSGTGAVRERRPAAASDPSRGAFESPTPSARGATIGNAQLVDRSAGQRTRGGDHTGGAVSAPGKGLADERAGIDHRETAPVGSARPDVTSAPVAVAALETGKPRDDAESEQQVATMIRSLVHASTAGGLVGEGEGGTGGGGLAAAGALDGLGLHARPVGVGDGDVVDYWTSDPRLLPYFRRMHAKIDPLWADAFPKSALLDLKQGTVILEFTVYADGQASVAWPPVRPSGIDEFDRNCAEAIRRAGPFPPLPRVLGVEKLRIRAPFIASNPIIK